MSSSLICAVAAVAGLVAASPNPPPAYLQADLPIDERVADLLSRMTLQEKVNQLIIPWPGDFTAESLVQEYGGTGVGAVYEFSVNFKNETDHFASMNMFQGYLLNYSRLGIPVTWISETLHSSRQGGTAFPNPTLLGHTWDTALVQQVGAVIGLEARTAGVGRGYAPVLQVVTDPRFGRYEEAFGEVGWMV
jgi:beta-glucosidase